MGDPGSLTRNVWECAVVLGVGIVACMCQVWDLKVLWLWGLGSVV